MGKVLTDRQKLVLERAAKEISHACTYYLAGGKMETAHALRACRQLERRGLMQCSPGGYYNPYFSITEAGREAIAALQAGGRGDG